MIEYAFKNPYMELTFKNITLYQEKLSIIKFKFKTKRGLMAKNNIILFR